MVENADLQVGTGRRTVRTARSAIAPSLCLGLLALPVQAAVLLYDVGHYQQDSFVIDDDVSTTNLEIKCTINWGNNSPNVPANYQVAANGTFGTNDGLLKITTTDPTHTANGPTYSIGGDSFNIVYAPGIVNTPGNVDSFKFHFTLPTGSAELAQRAVDELNARISGVSSNALYSRAASINGEVASYDPFENSPIFFIPDPTADPDADGFTSWDEFVAATSPTNAASFPSIGTFSNGLTFATATGRVYTVEGCGALGEHALPDWNTVTNLPGSGNSIEVPFGTNQFYRLKISLP